MTQPKNSSITNQQLLFFLLQTQVGVGVLSLPYDVQSIAKGAGWISVMIAGVVTQIIILIHWALCKRFPHDTLYAFLPKIVGKWIGGFIGFIYICYFLLISALILVMFHNVINKWVLIQTPRWAILLLITGTGIYLAKENLRIITRFHVFISFLIIFLIVLVLISYRDVDFTYIFPITEAGWVNIIKGADTAWVSMLGFEALLMVYPFTEGTSTEKLKAASLANLMVTLLYTFMTFTSLIIFSPQEIELVPEPILYMFKAYSFQIIERIDLFFLIIWVMVVTASLITYLYLTALGVGKFFHKGQHQKSIPYIAAICFVIALFPQDQPTQDLFGDMMSIFGYVTLIGIPLILLTFSYLFRKGETKKL